MTSNRDDLDPIEPSTARDLYLDHKATECANSTVRNYRYALKSFLTRCEKEDIDNLNVLTGRHLHKFRVWRKEDGDLAPMTLRTQMSGLRVFLQWAGSIEAVPENLYQKVMIPRVPREERRCTRCSTATGHRRYWIISQSFIMPRSSTLSLPFSGGLGCDSVPSSRWTLVMSISKRRSCISSIGQIRERR